MAPKIKSSNLVDAKKAKKDEFYTQLPDIERELKHYKAQFKGKVVYCNCDDPAVSQFFHYFSYNFEHLGLKKLITTCYQSQAVDLFSQGDSEQAVYLEYEGDKDGDRVPNPEEIGIKSLKADGDFRSAEAIELLNDADIVVTNPPFSLFREYVAQLIEHEKKFLIIGNKNAITYKETFPLIKENKLWLGNTPIGQDMLFRIPDDAAAQLVKGGGEGSKWRRVDGDVLARASSCWFTNLDVAKRHEELILYATYSPEKYPTYDNYEAIEVSKVAEIPADYAGVMGVPITFLGKYNPEQFEILGLTQRGCHDAVPDTKKYDDYWEVRPDGTKTGSSGGKTNENANLLGDDGRKNHFVNAGGHVVQSSYQRIFIRHRKAAS